MILVKSDILPRWELSFVLTATKTDQAFILSILAYGHLQETLYQTAFSNLRN